jgi:hypothetical protein
VCVIERGRFCAEDGEEGELREVRWRVVYLRGARVCVSLLHMFLPVVRAWALLSLFALKAVVSDPPVMKVPVIEVLKKTGTENSILGSLFSQQNAETVDVTMTKFGHKLAFRIIHPEIGENGAVRPVTGENEFVVIDDENLDSGADGDVTSGKDASAVADVVEKRCVSWRQTGNCDPNGPRESEKDLPCDAVIHTGASGYCECENGRRVGDSDCEHQSFICENECMGNGVGVVVPVDHVDVKEAFQASKLFEETAPPVINRQLAQGRPFFLVVLCACKGDIDLSQRFRDRDQLRKNWPLDEFETRVRESGYDSKFTFLYVLPSTARSFSLYEQYSLTTDRPWVVIDNIPNGPMNEKFLGPKVPGATAAELMGMLNNFFDYKLQLLVRSAPLPATGIVAGDVHGRRMRGASSDSHVVEVVSDTFREIVLDPTRACFLLLYSPECPASRSVLPVLEDVATHHKDLENVTIAKMDLIHNDLPIRDVVCHHYPTAYLFPAGTDGNKRHPEYRAPINFANYKGENTPHPINQPHAHWSVEEIAHFIEHEIVKRVGEQQKR